MILIPIRCPHCQEAELCRNGHTRTGKQRYICKNPECLPRSFTLEPHPHNGTCPEVKQQIVDMAINGSGVRDTARILKVSPVTVIKELKKKRKR